MLFLDPHNHTCLIFFFEFQICTVGPQRGSSDVLSVQFDSRAGSTLGFSYDRPSVTSVTPSDAPLPTTGQSTITLMGANFGDMQGGDLTAFVGRTACAMSKWVSDTAIECKVSAGAGASVIPSVRRWGLTSSAADPLTYTPPVLSVPSRANYPRSASVSVILNGSGFGPSGGEGQQMCVSGSVPPCTPCTSWISDTSISCPLASGTGSGLDLSIIVGGKQSPILSGVFSYDQPIITGLNPINGPTRGLPQLTVMGANFGAAPNGRVFSGTVGGQPCIKPSSLGVEEGVDWISDSSLKCGVPPGSGKDLDVVINLGTAGEPPVLFAKAYSYVPEPIASQVQLLSQSYPERSGGDILITGARFAVEPDEGVNETTVFSDPGIRAFVGRSECSRTTWLSTSSVACTVGPGAGRRLDVRVQVFQGVSTLQEAFSYAPPPTITAVDPKRDTVVGRGSTLTIYGKDFQSDKSDPAAVVAKINGVPCQDTSWVSDTAVVCVAPPAPLEDGVPVSVIVHGQEGTMTKAFDYSGAGVVPRLGIRSPLPQLWLDASTPSDITAVGPVPFVKYVSEWRPRLSPPVARGDPAFVFEQPEEDKRPHLVGGAIRFDGTNDELVANQVLIRPVNTITMFAAVRIARSYRDARGFCVARPVVWVSADMRKIRVQSPNDGAFTVATGAPKVFRIYDADGNNMRSPDDVFQTFEYQSMEYKPREGALPAGFVFEAPPAVSFPSGAGGLYYAVPDGMRTPCSPGWMLSDNDLTDSKQGIGIYIDQDGLVRPVAGTDTLAVSSESIGYGWHVLSLQLTDKQYTLRVDGSIDAGFDLSLSTSSPWVQQIKALSGTVPMYLGARSVGGGSSDKGYFHGDIGEIAIYTQVLTAAKVATVERSLCARWRKGACSPPAFAGLVRFRWSGGDILKMLESEGSAKAVLQRVGGSDGYLRVRYNPRNGTARSGVHFLANSGIADWAHGDDSERIIDVARLLPSGSFCGDAKAGIDNGNRSFSVTLQRISAEFPVELEDTTAFIVSTWISLRVACWWNANLCCA